MPWIWTIIGIISTTVSSALSAEKTATWRICVALILAPSSLFCWWLARRTGAEYLRHGVVWDVTISLTTVLVGLVIAGEILNWKKVCSLVLGIIAIWLAAKS